MDYAQNRLGIKKNSHIDYSYC